MLDALLIVSFRNEGEDCEQTRCISTLLRLLHPGEFEIAKRGFQCLPQDRKSLNGAVQAWPPIAIGELDVGRLVLSLLPFPQADAWAAAVFVDQFDAGRLECVLQAVHG